MVLILFLVDTSASMNQKTYLGTSYLDVAKVAIETFMKVGRRPGESLEFVGGRDRYDSTVNVASSSVEAGASCWFVAEVARPDLRLFWCGLLGSLC